MRLTTLDWQAERTFELTSEAKVRRAPSPVHVGLAFALIALIVMLEALIYHAYLDVSATNQTFREATFIATDLADVQREALFLRSETALLRTPGNLAGVRRQRDRLEAQITASFPDANNPIARTLRSTLEPVDEILAGLSDAARPEKLKQAAATADDALRILERQIALVYDQEEGRVYGALSASLRERVNAQRRLILLGALVVLAGVALAMSMRRRIRRDFEAAQQALAEEFDERRTAEAKLEHWAYHDSLTGLANRALFRERVEHAITRARRNGSAIAVLFLDLDDFKKVNDSLGHVAGDELLLAVAERLRECMRPADTAARLGGDEFAVLLEDAGAPVDAARVAERMLSVLGAPVRVQGKDMAPTASIGIALNSGGDESVDDLLRNADLAMYTVKSDGKGRFEMFRPELHAAVLARLELEADLRAALANDELALMFQPIVRLDTGEVIGVEALARWGHPTRGELQPSSFIPIAEETGLIVPMGRTLMR